MAGLLSRMFGRGRIEQRRQDPFFYPSSLSFGQKLGVSPRQAEMIACVQACVCLIANAISSLPAALTVDTPDGRAPAPRTATGWALLQRPNRFQGWPTFAHWATWQLLIHGNAVCWLGTDGRGAITELRPISWPSISPQVIVGADGRRLVYDVTAATVETAGLPRRMLDSDVLHVRSGHSDGGIVGQSVLRAGGPVNEAAELETLVAALWSNSMRPSGTLSLATYLSEVQRTRYSDTFIDGMTGAINAGKTVLLEGGMKFEPVSNTPQDAELLGSRAHNVADICRLFGIPEMLMQTGQRSLADPQPYLALFCAQALAPIVVALESEFDHAILPTGTHLQLDMSGLMRGSFSQIAAALCATTQSGITTANDARRAMGWPAIEGGDVLCVNGAMPADRLGMPSLSPKPGPTGDGVAMPSHGNEGARPNGKMVMQ